MTIRADPYAPHAYTNPYSGLYSMYVLTHKDGRAEYFDGNGKLIGMSDKYGNQIHFEYDYTIFGGVIGGGVNKEYTITTELWRAAWITSTTARDAS